MPAKSAIERRKLKNGPASTVSIRRPTEAPWKLVRRSSGLIRARASGSLRLEPSPSPLNLT